MAENILFVVKQADEHRTDRTAPLTADSELVLSLEADKRYWFEIVALIWNESDYSANTQCRVSYSGSAAHYEAEVSNLYVGATSAGWNTNHYRYLRRTPAELSGGTVTRVDNSTGNTTTYRGAFVTRGYITTSTAGTLSVDWRHNNNGFDPAPQGSTVFAGSWITAHDLFYGTGETSEFGSITLADVVEDVAQRAGLDATQIITTDLSEEIDGYAITRQMTARNAIEPLRAFGFFDCVERDGQLVFPTRGKATVATITADDLAAHEGQGQRPASVEVTRMQTVELPLRLRVHYMQSQHLQEAGEQTASRISAPGTELQSDIELAISMTDTKALQIAETVLYESWVARTQYKFSLDHSWLHLEPADAIVIPVDGQAQRVRITNIDHALPGLLSIDAVADDDGVFTSYAVAADSPTPAGGGRVAIYGTSDPVFLDLPALRDEDSDAGYYVAVQAVGSNTFGGAVIYRSADAGVTYDSIGTVSAEACIGTVSAALPAGPSTIIDEGNTLVVDCDDTLESIGEATLLAGGNAAAIGLDGRWEIIQFRDATLSGSPQRWYLTGLLRGRRGTEHAIGTSQAGDRFVLLDAAVERLTQGTGSIGALRLLKAVLVGTTIDATNAVPFTGNGVALEPFAPVHISGTRNGSGDLLIEWIRRGRLGQELPSGTDIPLSEETESYGVDVMNGETVVRTLVPGFDQPYVTYTAAQQVTDWGSTQAAVTVRVYQISATVGRGYPGEATV